jgi:hypothetical protein
MSRMMLECFGGSLDLKDHWGAASASELDLEQPGMTATIVLPKDPPIPEKIVEYKNAAVK